MAHMYFEMSLLLLPSFWFSKDIFKYTFITLLFLKWTAYCKLPFFLFFMVNFDYLFYLFIANTNNYRIN